MSDEIKQEPVEEVKVAEELSAEELDKANGGSMYSTLLSIATGTVVPDPDGPVSPRDASGGLPTGKRM
jgi:hypothetical protein